MGGPLPSAVPGLTYLVDLPVDVAAECTLTGWQDTLST